MTCVYEGHPAENGGPTNPFVSLSFAEMCFSAHFLQFGLGCRLRLV